MMPLSDGNIFRVTGPSYMCVCVCVCVWVWVCVCVCLCACVPFMLNQPDFVSAKIDIETPHGQDFKCISYILLPFPWHEITCVGRLKYLPMKMCRNALMKHFYLSWDHKTQRSRAYANRLGYDIIHSRLHECFNFSYNMLCNDILLSHCQSLQLLIMIAHGLAVS